MKIIRGLENITEIPDRVAVSMGNFDGLHIGHQHILVELRRRVRNMKGTSVVVTFHPHPLKIVAPDKAPKMITTLEQRLELLEKQGIDIVIIIDFTRKFSEVRAADFVNTLYEKLKMKEIFVGKGFRFGKGAEGNLEMLNNMGESLGFKAFGMQEVFIGGGKIGSTRLRKMIELGEMSKVAIFLGRPYSVEGVIVKGDGRGEGLGFPTANIETINEILPMKGVYLTNFDLNGSKLEGMTYIGDRPTFNAGFAVETFLMDFDKNIVGKRAKLEFLKRLRGDIKFDSSEALVEQMKKDLRLAEEYFGKNRLNDKS